MREAGRRNARVLEAIREAIKPGVSTAHLNDVAERTQARLGVGPVFKGYSLSRNLPPFPATITVCLNEELVHGIPRADRILQEGDLITVDCASCYQGYIGDSAFSMGVDRISDDAQRLIDVTERALYVGIEQAHPGNRLGDLSSAIQQFVESNNYNVVRGYGGHGVGRTMHEDPHVPNYGLPSRGTRLRPGMTFAIEPMVLQGSEEVVTLPDQWTVVAKDGKLTAHCEHTIAVTNNGPEILTLL